MTWCRTSIAYTTALCELFDSDDNCIAQECRVCSYGYEDIQFVICHETYYDELDNQFNELYIKSKCGDHIVDIHVNEDDCISHKMFIELCCDYFISAFIELYYTYGSYKRKKEFDNILRTVVEQFLTERNYSNFDIEVI